jgi:hypothetical protein
MSERETIHLAGDIPFIHADYLWRTGLLGRVPQCCQLASNSAFAASSAATRLSVRRFSSLLGTCNAQTTAASRH